MDAVAGGGGVQHKAGDGGGVVGDLGALVCGQAGGGVAIARGDDGEVVRLQCGAEARGEREGDVLLGKMVVDVRAGLRAAVGGVKQDDGALRERREGDTRG